jgi:spore germination cell wall hydrolase CwlJ-like protein
MIAVNQVVMNRVESDLYPDTPCDVVFQGPVRQSWRDPSTTYPVRDRCQFSWYCDGKSDEVSKEDQDEREAWFRAVRSSWEVLDGSHDDLVDGALWYHADYVDPDWNKDKEITSIIGSHIFYR